MLFSGFGMISRLNENVDRTNDQKYDDQHILKKYDPCARHQTVGKIGTMKTWNNGCWSIQT